MRSLWVGVLVVAMGSIAGGFTPGVPPNVQLSPSLARVVQRMHDGSPTFRAQCSRLASATRVQVRMRLVVSGVSRCRARTTLVRRGRELHADVQVPPGADLVELIAHEFEHIIEQIDGVDVRRLARVSGSGVWEVERELFESRRAQHTGRTVARETREYRERSAD